MGEKTLNSNIRIIAVVAAIAFLYATVLAKLGGDWWSDENYSHGLLVPFVIGLIVWKEWDDLKSAVSDSWPLLGGVVVLGAILLLLAGTLGAELFTQRISLVLMLGGTIVYLFGVSILIRLAVPFVLLLLSIPVPQIIFNRIAFPLQIWASQMAVWGIRLFEVPTLRKGNVIDILSRGATQTISLEVVEACSGIRSLMTLVTLALILVYFTRRDEDGPFGNFSGADLLRAVILMILAVPIAVLTNAARVTGTGVLTYYYGKQATESAWHDASGWLVYVVALVLLIGANYLLRAILRGKREYIGSVKCLDPRPAISRAKVLPLVAVIVAGGMAVNWFVTRGETPVERTSLTALSTTLGEWQQRGDAIKFDPAVERVLRTTDHTMREYTLPDGRLANLYVGYYASQRTGATYHSPQNCLPGAGWVMKDPQYIDITTADGQTFRANRYIIQNGIYNEVMIYWYQGRGRIEASEYNDKANTIWDSVTRGRSDGAIVRVMTSVGSDEDAAVNAAVDLSAHLSDQLSPFVPE
jgi:exosortase D (VPLPA-CTERM-specific)